MLPQKLFTLNLEECESETTLLLTPNVARNACLPFSLNIMYNISDFLHFPARDKMYEGAARVDFISAKNVKIQKFYILLG